MRFIYEFAPVKNKVIRWDRKPWFDSEVHLLIKERIKLEKIKDKSKDLQSLKLFRKARNKVTMALNIKKRDF